jgi:hypothetical protein
VSAPAPGAREASDAVAPAPVGPNAGYDKGFFLRSDDGNYKLTTKARVQSRFTYVATDKGPEQAAFSVERARLVLKGNAFGTDFEYFFQTEFGKNSPSLKDFYVDYKMCSEARVRAGQWTRPFARQHITSDGSQEMLDRSSVDKAFGSGRDVGLALQNDYEQSPEFEYAVGVFNGTGDAAVTTGAVVVNPATNSGTIAKASASNVPSLFDPAVVFHVGYNYGGIKGYSEADLEGGGLRFGVAAASMVNFDANNNDDSRVRAELDGVLKLEGLSLSSTVYVASKQTGSGFGDRASDAIGSNSQIGYVIGKKFQPAFRFGVVSKKKTPGGLVAPNAITRELGLALNYYIEGHSLALTTEGAMLHVQDTNTDDLRWTTQLQLGF